MLSPKNHLKESPIVVGFQAPETCFRLQEQVLLLRLSLPITGLINIPLV